MNESRAPGAASGAAGLAPGARLADFRTSPRVLLLVAMAVAIGSMSTLAAWALIKLIALATNLSYFGRWSTAQVSIADTPLGIERVLIPVLGGLIIGLMARFGSEKIRGHGIPEAIEAILLGGSRIQARTAILKPLSSAVSIGTGGPFGAEGPIIMTGGAIGSLFAQLFHLSSSERKALLVAGAAAGMTGIFGTPVAAILLAVELLLFEWRPRSFLPVVAAVTVAASLRALLLPTAPIFPFAATMDVSVLGLGAWAAVGVAAGMGSAALTALVYGFEDAFHKLPWHWMWWPAIGGFVVGVGGLVEPSALGVGYDNIRDMLDGHLAISALLTLLLIKALIWSVALGSGTSGGVLAPLLIMGGAIGAIIGLVFSPHEATTFALLGMAAMMGGTMRSPLTATIFGVELTGDIHMLLPLMTACAVAHGFTVLVLKRSILTERIARRGHHLTREYSVDPFELMRVKDVMVTRVDTLPASLTCNEAIQFFSTAEPRHQSYPVIGARRELIGMVSRADILRWIVDEHRPEALKDLFDSTLLTAAPDELVGELADRMGHADVGRVPVVHPDTNELVGIVARKDLLRVRARALTEEHERSAPLRRGSSG